MMNERTRNAWTDTGAEGENWTHFWFRAYEPDTELTADQLARLGENERKAVENHEAYSQGSGVPGAMYHHGVHVVSVAQTMRGNGRYPFVTVLLSQSGGYDI